MCTQQKGKQQQQSSLTQRVQETTTPEGEPGAQYLPRRNVQISLVDVSMADASYRQVSTRDIQMIDAPIPLRPNTSATINHPATRIHEDRDVTMISPPEIPQQVQQSPVRYYGGTKYRDPPPEIQSSSATESPRRSGLAAQNNDSIWIDDRVYQHQAGSQHPFRNIDLGQTHQKQAEIDKSHVTRIDEDDSLQITRIEEISNLHNRVESDHTKLVKHHGVREGAQEIRMPIRKLPQTTRQTQIPAQEVRFHGPNDNLVIQEQTEQVYRRNQMEEVPRQRVYKENIRPLNAMRPDSRDMNTPVMTDSEVRCIIMEIKRSVTTEEKYSGKKYNFLALRIKAFQALCRSGGIPQEIWARIFPAILSGPANEYYLNEIDGKGYTFEGIVEALRQQFGTRTNR
ncbi:hypothetical protein E4U59_005823 [Claviceps monticola]|nr:hypothetical protein E4U59_005823 [Claviceps monticola]